MSNPKAASLTSTAPELLGLDRRNDSIENMDVVLEFNESCDVRSQADFIIKWHPRREDNERWLRHAEAHGRLETPRAGKRVKVSSVEHERKRSGYE